MQTRKGQWADGSGDDTTSSSQDGGAASDGAPALAESKQSSWVSPVGSGVILDLQKFIFGANEVYQNETVQLAFVGGKEARVTGNLRGYVEKGLLRSYCVWTGGGSFAASDVRFMLCCQDKPLTETRVIFRISC